mgnify:CR=1 FL=1
MTDPIQNDYFITITHEDEPAPSEAESYQRPRVKITDGKRSFEIDERHIKIGEKVEGTVIGTLTLTEEGYPKWFKHFTSEGLIDD